MGSQNERNESKKLQQKTTHTKTKSITIESIQAFYLDALYLNNNCFAIEMKADEQNNNKNEHKNLKKKRIRTENNVKRNLYVVKLKTKKKIMEILSLLSAYLPNGKEGKRTEKHRSTHKHTQNE